MNDAKNFGVFLKNAREEIGLTLSQLGDLIGYSNPYLSQIETGKRKNPPSPELLKKLSEAMGNVTYAGLLDAAGYHELAKNESMKQLYEDFGGDNELSVIELRKKVEDLQKTSDLKKLLSEETLWNEKIAPRYNGHKLTEQDRKRILKMLEILFPEYQDKK
ncbi:helix-turn-helix transcriptional regulator [Lysinibacillus macroides]|uniref:helix-turn-helix domain-containing protein n=1 Tax=Lysinibacillus macroides TaxID=33935 RepID=UPI0006B617AE|nr:helix-turn-helix transcriptional regulator [Lysinibacillus macroides]QPR68585.1 helix-turn-helix transcriptional regulator [Lysinibacillus macroides]